MATVSIGLPVYNGARFLAASLESLDPDVRAGLEESIRRLRASCEAEREHDAVTTYAGRGPRAPGPHPVVPARQAQAMAERLNRGGGKAQVVILGGQGQTWQGEALIESIDRMLKFLDETLKR